MIRPRSRRLSAQRRGVLLLVVLSLLVLFVLSGLTFVVVTQQYRRTARQIAVKERAGDSVHKVVDRALNILLRDSTNMVPVNGHSLLRDFYGGDGFQGTLLDSQASVNLLATYNNSSDIMATGQLVDVVAAQSSFQPFQTYVDSPVVEVGYYNGRVFTFTSGPAKGISTRIVYCERINRGANRGNWVFRLIHPKAKGGKLFLPDELANSGFVVNGAIFNGTGFGYDNVANHQSSTVALNRRRDSRFSLPVALQPNSAARAPAMEYGVVNYTWLFGGADEGYDVPDYQNLALGMNTPAMILPSFHRPALINYWYHRLVHGDFPEPTDSMDPNLEYLRKLTEVFTTNIEKPEDRIAAFEFPYNVAGLSPVQQEQLVNFKRTFILRPLREDHPNFTGSNPDFRLIVDPSKNRTPWSWDIDNDSDGVPDSIWVDFGLPSQSTIDGRMYKPLVAVLCLDLDGRLNVNAHGRRSELKQMPNSDSDGAPDSIWLDRTQTVTVGGGSTTGSHPEGLGYGPPEISLFTAIAKNSVTKMKGIFNSRFSTPNANDRTPGDNTYDKLARIKFHQESRNHWKDPLASSYLSSPPDLHGELSFGLDIFGQPTYEKIERPATVDLRAGSPYESNLVDRSGTDWLFSVGELESVLRSYDSDASSSSHRLRQWIDHDRRHLITTESFDPPVTGVSRTTPIINRETGEADAHGYIVDHLAKRLQKSGIVPLNDVPLHMDRMLWPEMRMGLRFDLNRPFGNGTDDDGNGIADEPMENPKLLTTGKSPEILQNARFNHNNGIEWFDPPMPDRPLMADSTMARHYYARHLYVLMMTLIENTQDATISRKVAQWAVNVVDFRDGDAIMTPFEYDPNPFNGWDVDGRIDGYLGQTSSDDNDYSENVVWGCERPELLISETLAFHDRRTEDRDDDDGVGTATDDAENPDPDFDQRLMPRGSFFVELYNPWTNAVDWNAGDQAWDDMQRWTPNELYGYPASYYMGDGPSSSLASVYGVTLDRVVRSESDDKIASPVWRLVLTGGIGLDADDITKHDRRVYFVDPTRPDLRDSIQPPMQVSGSYWPSIYAANKREHSESKPAMVPIRPGHYAVIGSPGTKTGRDYVTPIGHLEQINGETDEGELRIAETRSIRLRTNKASDLKHDFSNVHQVRIENNIPEGTAPHSLVREQPSPLDVLPASAVIIDQPRPLSISEPRDGYKQAPGARPLDKPLDSNVINDSTVDPRLMMTQTLQAYKTVHLQRLANPLAVYDPVHNPYRTIDSMRCDLTAFNGIEGVGPDNDDPGAGLGNFKVRFRSTQRGDDDLAVPDPTFRRFRRLWPQEHELAPVWSELLSNNQERWPVEDPTTPPNAGHEFNYLLRSTLGYLNHGYGARMGRNAILWRGGPDTTDPVNISKRKTFASLAWNDRPFVSQYELMLVPKSSSRDLLKNFTVYNIESEVPSRNAYEPKGATSQFGHLLNFFGANEQTLDLEQIHRLFDFVEVPSRFVGTDSIFNASQFDGHDDPDNNLDERKTSDMIRRSGLLSPFNYVSKFRDPGRININTMDLSSNLVWSAIVGSYRGGPTRNEIQQSRQGYLGTFDPASPTFFANPFRPSGSGKLVPIDTLVKKDIECTLLRPNPDNKPLMENELPVDDQHSTPRDTRNAQFRYEFLRKLGNVVTTRSNVYAIWITVGYFELESNPGGVDAAHPDGYRLSQELGSDTGEITRNRGFFIVDRTIPVAFEPGENHNVDNCVLLRRYIE